ncbi:MAG: DUF3800 domain-containing protein [Verrucomicrobiae bacterium]|nr:DUF3800 domain-containing protein [Verrucomicrobiae bacterium]
MDDAREYWIFADESVQDGELFSKFFGGCIVPAHRHAEIESRLAERKEALGFGRELKWQRVTDQRLADYMQMVTTFFDELRADRVRMRVVFQDNLSVRRRSSDELRHEPYYKLYYQFIKHAFGLAHMPEREEGTRLRLFLDRLPHTEEHTAQFKSYLAALPLNSQLRDKRLRLDPSHIAEVDSRAHVLLQCVDIVLGSMAFRFNEKHLTKPAEAKFRGKRTIAKEKLYKHILAEIRTLKPHFHPKISTACEPYPEGSWSMPYRHWLFKPRA